MKLTTPATAIFVVILLSAVSLAHTIEPAAGSGQTAIESALGIPDPVKIVLLSSAVVAFFVTLSLIFKKSFQNKHKKIIFILITVPIIFATLYLVGVTLALNTASATKGPVHWHADMEVWACGNKYHFVHSTGWDNKVGESLMHLHDDDRMHIEGVVMDMKDIELGEFFHSVGGEFNSDSITMPTTEGVKKWFNGYDCNGKMGWLYMFVNGKLEKTMDEYIISPYFNIPPGDTIKIVFSEKPLDKINPKFSEAP
ncbi:MAG: hypothetical protein HYT71_03905 [Candidatus Aenigmarchaeota archaeon]|nr:hypothetical protein [Candidatus Aenigmarchaeota archaeon]